MVVSNPDHIEIIGEVAPIRPLAYFVMWYNQFAKRDHHATAGERKCPN
jgi:hypothetical protein